jgi:respiratory burst oxidase
MVADEEENEKLISSSADGDVDRLRSSLRASLQQAHKVFVESGEDAALATAFDKLDLKGNGRLDRSEINIFLEEAAKHVRLEVEQEIIDMAVDALIDSARQGKDLDDDDSSRFISRDEFYDLFYRHPDMLRVFEDEQSFAALRASVRSQVTQESTPEELELEKKEQDEVWQHAHTHWKNRKTAIVWFVIYFLGNAFAFIYKAIKYSNQEEAQAVFGNCITVARGAAQCLNLNAALVLLLVCRHFLTRLRATKLRWIFPFDASLEAHILVGIAFALFSTAHVCAHICDFHRFGNADEDDIYALFGDKLGVVPEGYWQRWALMLKQPAGITGIIMTLCLIVAYAFIPFRRKAFNRFWFSHHLLIVMLIALCCHGIDSLLEPFQSVYWLIFPFIMYFVPRMLRETKLSKTKVLDVSIVDSDMSILRLEKPKHWRNYVQSGMYASLNIPSVSCAEWHPFTLTSAPHEEHISFAFKSVGDWTEGARDVLADAATEGDDSYPTVKVEGPIGASSQGFSDYPIVVLIGAGIGITPMISVIKHLLHEPGKMKRTFFYWTVRDRASFDWFASVLDDIYEHDNKHVLQTRHFLTSVKYDDRDLGAVLLHHATRSKHRNADFDLLLGRRTHHQVEVGRPDWDAEFRAVRDEAKDLGHCDCGVFLCGPEKMAEAVDEASFEISRDDPDFHFYFTKETF